MSSEIGVVGLGVMGRNLALNIADHGGFSCSIYNRTYARTEEAMEVAQREGGGRYPLHPFRELHDFVASLKRPRRIIMMLTAGSAVEAVTEQLLPMLEEGDILIDGGNEWYQNTERRQKWVAEKGIQWVGMGVSGGEEGARHGPSLMPGGPRAAFEALQPILEGIAAKVDDGPCVTYIGPGAAGNYVKMVHNGIEYGDMQLLADSYDLLRRLGHLSNEQLAAAFSEWNRGELESFLIEITAKVFAKRDDLVDDGTYLVDKILDQAGSKGTGKWTIQEGAEKAVPIPSICAALDARYVSAHRDIRVQGASILTGPTVMPSVDAEQLVKDVRQALYCAKICCYAQGLHLLTEASKVHSWDLNMGSISRIWKGGCIIRAVFLDRIKRAFDRHPDLPNLLFDEEFATEIAERQAAWRRVVALAAEAGIAVPAFSASLNYYDSIRSARLPANLIQAQRDFFGAHTFQRLDRPGTFHAEWSQ